MFTKVILWTWKKLDDVSLIAGEGETSESHHPIISCGLVGPLQDGFSITICHFIHCKHREVHVHLLTFIWLCSRVQSQLSGIQPPPLISFPSVNSLPGHVEMTLWERQTFNIAWTEVLPVLLQSFIDILLILHLNEGLSWWPPHPVQREMDSLHPITDPTLWKVANIELQIIRNWAWTMVGLLWLEILHEILKKDVITTHNTHLRRTSGYPQPCMTTGDLLPARCTPPSSLVLNVSDRAAVVGILLDKVLLPEDKTAT